MRLSFEQKDRRHPTYHVAPHEGAVRFGDRRGAQAGQMDALLDLAAGSKDRHGGAGGSDERTAGRGGSLLLTESRAGRTALFSHYK